MVKTFIETLMDSIMETTMIPKAQTEWGVEPILSIFIADVLTETLREDPDLSGSIYMICPEFPLRKKDNNQSTNIDWLMVNPERSQLLFVELKTADTSDNSNQSEIYRAIQKEVMNRKTGSFLIEDLKQIKDASNESGKYQFILENKVLPYQNEIAACHEVKILYLVPVSMKNKVQSHADRVLTFGMLAKSYPGSFAEEWSIIHSRLCELDDLSRLSRNIHAPKLQTTSGQNYKKIYNFDAILNLCKERGDSILVGFMGGISEFEKRDIDSLQERAYKWDEIAISTGAKEMRNWIPGSTFLKIMEEKKNNIKSTGNEALSATPKRSSNWQGTLKFHEMVQFCLDQGDNIIIEFNGGKEVFARSSLDGLKMRLFYKWDYEKNLAGKRQSDWLPGTLVIEMLKKYYGYSVNRE